MRLGWDLHLTSAGFRSGVLWQRCTGRAGLYPSKPGDEFATCYTAAGCGSLRRSSYHMPNTLCFAQL